MTDWYIRLQGELFDLRILSDIFKSKELNIFEKEGHYYLYNKDFCNLTNPEEVNKKAEVLLQTLNGIARAENNKYKPVVSEAILFYNENGNRKCFAHFSGTLEFRSSVSADLSVEEKDGKVKKLFKKLTNKINSKSWVKASIKNGEVKRALGFFGKKKLSWNELYKILEIIKEDTGDDIYSWAPKSKIRNFKHTANSFITLGNDARHGVKDKQPPSKPVSLEEAKSLIRNILVKWIGTKEQ